MDVAFTNSTTKVSHLAEQISLAISNGEFEVGESLPSINELSKKYSVSRDTVCKAFSNLKERGLIDSVPGKGFYVLGKRFNILLLLDHYSSFKNELYNNFVKSLSTDYTVDLLFHEYNEYLFDTFIKDSIGRYNRYVVMSFHNEILSGSLSKIDKNKLLLLDFGKFDKSGYSYICQDYDENFYKALAQLETRFRRYKKIALVFSKGINHPESSIEFFIKFCKDFNFRYELINDMHEREIERGTAYIVVQQSVVVSILKKGRVQGFTCGEDFGLLGYNDYPFYDVMDVGITSITIDFAKMGRMAADFIKNNITIREYLNTEIRMRHSL